MTAAWFIHPPAYHCRHGGLLENSFIFLSASDILCLLVIHSRRLLYLFHRLESSKMTRVSISYPPPSPLPPKARDLIISTLITTSAVKNLNSTLLATCQSTGWLDAVRQRALQLLRSGECTTFREVMDVLTREIWEELDRKKSDTSQIRNFISSHKRIEGEYRGEYQCY